MGSTTIYSHSGTAKPLLLPPNIPAREYPGTHPGHYRGKQWNWFTLGIPLIAYKITSFFRGIIYREKAGKTIGIQFNIKSVPENEKIALYNFKNFYHTSQRPLRINQRDRLIQICRRLNIARQNAQANHHLSEVNRCTEKINNLEALLKKNMTKKASRQQFNEIDWALVDEIDYELIQEHCSNLHKLFNAKWFNILAQKKQLKDSFSIDYCEALVAEIIAFNIAYVQNLEGKSLDLPIYDPKLECYRNAKYKITFTTVGDTLPCYVLESEDKLAHPWFTIRGTQRFTSKTSSGQEMRIGSSESILADFLDPYCVTGNLINKAIVKRPIVKITSKSSHPKYVQKESLEDIFRRLRSSKKKVNIAGHSLGATIANTLGVEFYDCTKTVYGFSPFGVSKKISDGWQTLKKMKSSSALPIIKNFVPEGDPIPSAGSRLIGDHYALSPIDTTMRSSLSRSHNRKHFWDDFKIHAVDVERENKKIERKFFEKLRILTGRLISVTLTMRKKQNRPDWWVNRAVYQKQADLLRQLRPNFFADFIC